MCHSGLGQPFQNDKSATCRELTMRRSREAINTMEAYCIHPSLTFIVISVVVVQNSVLSRLSLHSFISVDRGYSLPSLFCRIPDQQRESRFKVKQIGQGQWEDKQAWLPNLYNNITL